MWIVCCSVKVKAGTCSPPAENTINPTGATDFDDDEFIRSAFAVVYNLSCVSIYPSCAPVEVSQERG